MQNTIETIKSLTFGTELEYTGIARQVTAKAIQGVIGGRVRFTGGAYDAWEVTAPDGRIWKAIRDGSLENGGCEVVTPILRWEDMETLQEVVRALRKAGAKATSDTSQHIHIGAQSFNPTQIANFAKIFYKQEELILKSLGTWEHRLGHYAKRTDRGFIERLNATRQITNESLNKAWFGELNMHPSHYENHRYRDLNLNNIWRTGTIEVRAANGSTHAGEIKANIILCLAIAAKALTAKSTSSKNRREYDTRSAKYDMRVFLVCGLGLNGDEFKNVRMHLLKRLPGSSAWKNAEQAA